MGRVIVGVTARSAAPPAAVYALLKDRRTWPSFSTLDSFEVEDPGDAHGIGMIGRIKRGPLRAREQTVELVPDRRMSYVLLSGLPMKDCRFDVGLTPDGTGTHIDWRASFSPTIPGSGPILRRVLTRALSELSDGLARTAAEGVSQ